MAVLCWVTLRQAARLARRERVGESARVRRARGDEPHRLPKARPPERVQHAEPRRVVDDLRVPPLGGFELVTVRSNCVDGQQRDHQPLLNLHGIQQLAPRYRHWHRCGRRRCHEHCL